SLSCPHSVDIYFSRTFLCAFARPSRTEKHLISQAWKSTSRVSFFIDLRSALMKSRHAITALVATLGLASSAALFAASPTTPDAQAQPGAGKHHGPGPGGHMHGGGMDFGFMHALHQLNLTDAQKQSVKSILDSNKEQMRSFHESMRSNHQALATMAPDDPN